MIASDGSAMIASEGLATSAKAQSSSRFQKFVQACFGIAFVLILLVAGWSLRHHAQSDLTLHGCRKFTKYSFIYAVFSVVEVQWGIHSS